MDRFNFLRFNNWKKISLLIVGGFLLVSAILFWVGIYKEWGVVEIDNSVAIKSLQDSLANENKKILDLQEQLEYSSKRIKRLKANVRAIVNNDKRKQYEDKKIQLMGNIVPPIKQLKSIQSRYKKDGVRTTIRE